MLVLHGFTETDLFWKDLLGDAGDAIAAKCALLPGHGWKPCAAGTTLASTATEFARVLAHEGSRDLLGYSLGGRLALQLAIDHPSAVKRLVLISCIAGVRDPAERAARLARDERLACILEEDGIGPFLAMWESNPSLRPMKPLPQGQIEILRSMRMNQDPLGLAAALRWLGVGTMADLWDRLGAITADTLLICGEGDQRYVAAMAQMCALIPRARLAVIHGSGHAVHREQPEAVRRMVGEFIAA